VNARLCIDELLKHVGSCLAAGLRAGDTAARLGGAVIDQGHCQDSRAPAEKPKSSWGQ
jgi:hypothetical protein